MSVNPGFCRAEIHSPKWDLPLAALDGPAEQSDDDSTSSEERPPSILLADEDDEFRDQLSRALRNNGFAVTECCDSEELAQHLDHYLDKHSQGETEGCFDLVISDIRMPGILGLSVVEGAEHSRSFPRTILITAFADPEVFAIAKRCGVLAVFSKPVEVAELLQVIRNEL